MKGTHQLAPPLLGLSYVSAAATLLFTCEFWRNSEGFWWLTGLLVTALLAFLVLGNLKLGQALIRKNDRALFYVLCGQLAAFLEWKNWIHGFSEIKYEVLAMIAGILWTIEVWATIKNARWDKERACA